MDIYSTPDVKPKRPPGRQPKHSQEYRMMIAKKVVEGNMSYRKAAKTYGISHGSVSYLVKEYNSQGARSKRHVRQTKYKKQVEAYRQESQLRDLKLEIAELYIENTLLKKALASLQQKESGDSSVITSENLERSKEDAR
jgi:transposase